MSEVENQIPETPEDKTKRLKRLAMDCAAGLVFTDRHCQHADDMRSVFMPLMLCGPAQLTKLVEQIGQRGVIYEYLSKAGPMAVNGLPSFFSMNVVPAPDADEFLRYWADERERRQAVA